MGRTSTAQRVTERLEDRLEPARGFLADAGDRARDTAEVARERLADVAETVEPQARRAGSAVADGVRAAVASMSFLPAVLSRVLSVLAGLTGSLAERSREVAHRVEPPVSVKRRSRLRAVLWFLGGFGAGTATGWVLHARMQEPPAPAEHEAYGVTRPDAPVSPIDARRENVRLN